jgi:thiol-disulfide isomerase/thioredoxin
VVGVLIAKNAGKKPVDAAPTVGDTPAAVEASAVPTTASEPAAQGKALPRLVDLGAHSCIPCKMMAPILEDLKKTYAGRMDVVFIAVWQNPDAGKKYGIDPKSGRPTIKAFADQATAEKERQASGGTVLALPMLQGKELANTCGFCDRAVYPEDAAEVIVGDVKTWGCCSHCALGVAARTGKDIEVSEEVGGGKPA